MSNATQPRPWYLVICDNGAQGSLFLEWADIVDDSGRFVARGLDVDEARKVVADANEAEQAEEAR